MAIVAEDFIKQIDEMTVLELNNLVKALEEHYGVSAAAAVAAAPAAGGGAAAAPVEEKTEFDVVLKSAGDKKINVIKASASRRPRIWSSPLRPPSRKRSPRKRRSPSRRSSKRLGRRSSSSKRGARRHVLSRRVAAHVPSSNPGCRNGNRPSQVRTPLSGGGHKEGRVVVTVFVHHAR
jgi:hypothetical protein